MAGVEEVAVWVEASARVAVLTGAGISTESGIPDFRGPQGVWTRDPKAERLSSITHYVADPEVRKAVWRSRLASPAWAARPNAAHLALVALERRGRLDTLVTQNVDGLHQLAGTSPEKVVELHGTIRRYRCLDCSDEGPIGVVLDRLRAGEEDPPCLACGGILKAATISFGQSLVPADLARAEAAARRADLLLAAGSSLGVYPAAGLVPLAKAAGARVVIVNAEPTPFDDLADAVLRGATGTVLPAIVGSPRSPVDDLPWRAAPAPE